MLSTLDTAQYWVDQGVSVIPICKQSKLPLRDWREFQSRLPTHTEMMRWFDHTRNNIGVVCGGQTNLAVLDFDDMQSYYKFITEILSRNDTWKKVVDTTYRVKTARGMHVYLRTEQPERSRSIPGSHIDIRANGCMVVTPPSIHPSGKQYLPVHESGILTVGSTTELYPAMIQNVGIMPIAGPCGGVYDVFDYQTGTIQEIKESANILDFVSQFTPVKRTSTDGRWWMSRCIHVGHQDKKPSLRIDAVRNRVKCLSGSCALYHDFGLDIIDLYSILYGKDLKTSLEDLRRMFL